MDKQLPNEVTAAVSNILKFLEKSEKDYMANIGKAVNNTAPKEEEYENS